jgi:hypothetical protein
MKDRIQSYMPIETHTDSIATAGFASALIDKRKTPWIRSDRHRGYHCEGTQDSPKPEQDDAQMPE